MRWLATHVVVGVVGCRGVYLLVAVVVGVPVVVALAMVALVLVAVLLVVVVFVVVAQGAQSAYWPRALSSISALPVWSTTLTSRQRRPSNSARSVSSRSAP